MKIVRLGALACTLAGAALLTGCVVAPADGVYYGDAYSTYSTSGYGYGYGYSGTPYYGGSSLIIESSPTYVYGGGRPYYRPGYHRPDRPSYGGGGGHYRPPVQGSRPSVSPSTGSHIGRPVGRGVAPAAPARSGGGGGGRFGSSWQQR